VRNIYYIARETFLLLRRDKIFLPAAIAGLLIAVFALLASNWSIEAFEKVLFDIGVFGFQFTGSIVALFWGHRMIADSRQDGALEVQLASPVSRTSWLLGKFFGLAVCLLFLGVIMLSVWQAVMLFSRFGWMTPQQLVTLAFTILGWLVLASTALFFATFCRPQVALFATLCLWICGLTSFLIAQSLTPETPPVTRRAVEFLARIWDFQQFNLVDWSNKLIVVSHQELILRGLYGIVLILVLQTTASITFQNRDLSG
jgi:ABC-type transport system involved in multi-copper enzyme maturation permease subunit